MISDTKENFTTSLDKTAVAVTLGVTLLFLLLIFGPYLVGQYSDIELTVVLSIFFSLIYFFAYGLSPKEYIITKDKLLVTSLFKIYEIKRNDIKSVERVERNKISGSIRTFGVGGLFGYFGKFSNSKFGEMTWYLTRYDKAVMITTIEGKKILVSPDKVESFLQQFN